VQASAARDSGPGHGPDGATRLLAAGGADKPFRARLRCHYHRVMSHARDERRALCDLLDRVGPGVPTLCEGWRTVDLAAHLVLREHRPDAGIGMLGGPMAGYTRRLQDGLVKRNPFGRLVQLVRTGPPRLSVFAIPGADERANVVEYFVHHEDVRRAQADWEPREIGADLADVLWRRARMARLVVRKAPVGIELVRDDLPAPVSDRPASIRLTLKAKTPVVTVTGPPAELIMWALGRTAAARVRLDGSEADVRALQAARWRI
jgi:uncharacterized protein (TIGR03085 family)